LDFLLNLGLLKVLRFPGYSFPQAGLFYSLIGGSNFLFLDYSFSQKALVRRAFLFF